MADDLSKPLGDATEGLLSAALSHAETGVCPAVSATATERPKSQSALQAELATIGKPPKAGKLVLP